MTLRGLLSGVLAAVTLFRLVCFSAWGQTPLDRISYSSDVTGVFNATLLRDQEAGDDDLAGNLTVGLMLTAV